MTLSPGAAGLVLTGLDLLAAAPLWVAELPAPEGSSALPAFAKVFALSRSEVCLVASFAAPTDAAKSGGKRDPFETLLFRLDAATGAAGRAGPALAARLLSAGAADVRLPGRVLGVFRVDHTSAAGAGGKSRRRFRLLMERGGERFVVLYPEPKDAKGGKGAEEGGGEVVGEYVHHLDAATGTLETYKVLPAVAAQGSGRPRTYALQPVGTAVFEPSSERIVATASPTPADAVNSPYTALGDDSLLLKVRPVMPAISLLT